MADLSFVVNKEAILWFEITMYNVSLVQIGHGITNAHRNLQNLRTASCA